MEGELKKQIRLFLESDKQLKNGALINTTIASVLDVAAMEFPFSCVDAEARKWYDKWFPK